jgi:isoaspartyl peptidase/L-asparaginase-like protein (Ntn-hydrolase superfamily)
MRSSRRMDATFESGDTVFEQGGAAVDAVEAAVVEYERDYGGEDGGISAERGSLGSAGLFLG